MQTVDLKRLGNLLHQREGIAAAFVFGSGQDGVVGEESDLDVAILFTEKPSPSRLYDLMAVITERLQFDKVDLTTLNTANCILAFEALSGNRLCVNDPPRLAEYASLTAREYEDTMAQIVYQQKLRHTG